MSERSWKRARALEIVAFAAVYFAAGKLGLALHLVHPNISPVWPPTALSLVALLVRGTGLWPGVALGALLVNATTAVPFAAVAGITLGNTLEAVLGVTLLRRAGFRPELDRARDVLLLLSLGALVAPVASATIGVLSLALTGSLPWERLLPALGSWWIGDSVSVPILAPVLLVWSRPAFGALPRARPRIARALELAALVALLVVACLLGFGDWPTALLARRPAVFICAVPMVWSAMRFGPRGAAGASLVVSGMALAAASRGLGPFGDQSPLRALAYLELVVLILAGTGLLLAATRAQHERALAEVMRRETELRRNRASLEAAQVIARMGSFEQDPSSGQRWWSPEIFRLLGVDPAAGTPPFEVFLQLLHPDDRARVTEANAQALRSRDVVVEELRSNPARGPLRHFIVRLRREHDAEGRPLHLAGTLQDITDRKHAEEERRALELQMQQAQKLESLGVLTGGIAHDFNNLLTAIIANTSLARSELPPQSPVDPFLEDAETAATRAAELTRQMLAYAGKARLSPSTVDLSELAQEMLLLLKTVISKSTELRCELAPRLPGCVGDPSQIRQIVMNLITNASEALGGGVGTVSLRTGVREVAEPSRYSALAAPDAPPGRYVYVEVTDTGAGMSAETLARIFDPFFTTKFTGRGLGLASVLGIVRSHRGIIKVVSAPGQGTTFEVLFPCGVSGHAAGPLAVVREDRWTGSGTVLLIDDDDAVRRAAARILRGSGFEVLQASDGSDGLEQLQQQGAGIVAVIVDLTMPGLDGLEVAEVIQGRAKIPVLLMSGHSDARKRAEEHPAICGFLEKPFTPGALRDSLRALLVS